MIGMGFKNVYALKGGWHEWNRAQFPTEPKGEPKAKSKAK
jgi:3-mercaptopyruvate sulfurtransferase SseA